MGLDNLASEVPSELDLELLQAALLVPMLLPMASTTSSAEARVKERARMERARERRASMARAKARGEAWTLKRSASLPISLHPLEAVLEEPLLEMLSDPQPGVSLGGSLTSHLQARLLEVLPAPWLGELLVPALAMLPPMGSAT